MFLRNENVLVTISDSINDLINAAFRNLFKSYQENMVEKMSENDFIIDCRKNFLWRPWTNTEQR